MLNEGTIKLETSANARSLPGRCKTFHGYEFCPDNDLWRIPDSSRMQYFNFKTLHCLCSEEVIVSLKKACSWFLINYSAGYSNLVFNEFKNLIKEVYDENMPCYSICSHHLLAYIGNLAQEKEHKFSILSRFLRKWYELGYSGIEEESIKLLNHLILKGDPRKGWPVLTMDPTEGPFTELELHAIHHEVNTFFGKGKIGVRLYCLIWLFIALGVRPVQIADIKISDFNSVGDKYLINIPRAKQRFKKRRTEFKKRSLVKEIGEVLEAWIIQIKDSARVLAPEINTMDLPLFPNWDVKGERSGFAYHSDGYTLSQEIITFFSNTVVKSHRTKDFMRITPQRFRYTLGTRAAMERQGPLVIAELLDHSDTQNVMVYTKATPEIVKKLDDALGSVLGKLSNAFKGEIVIDCLDIGHPLDPAKQVRVPRLDPKKGGVGYCGTCVGCNANLPYLCYICSQFKAWADGPHEKVLQDLLDERRVLLETTGDETIAFANDHLILAVAQVVDMCKEIKYPESRGNGRKK